MEVQQTELTQCLHPHCIVLRHGRLMSRTYLKRATSLNVSCITRACKLSFAMTSVVSSDLCGHGKCEKVQSAEVCRSASLVGLSRKGESEGLMSVGVLLGSKVWKTRRNWEPEAGRPLRQGCLGAATR